MSTQRQTETPSQSSRKELAQGNAGSQPQNTFAFSQLDAEMWLLGRLQHHLAQIFTGATDPEIRRERVRRAIIVGELEAVILGKRAGGGAETYAQAFERLYNEPLHKPKSKGK